MDPAPRWLIIMPLFLFSLLLSGCTQIDPTTSFSNTYQGYPCDGRCDQFKAGFETAAARQFTQDKACSSLPQDQEIGCLSYLHEYRIANNDKI
jgi:hypothetical protein